MTVTPAQAVTFPLHLLDDLPVDAVVRSTPTRYGSQAHPQHGLVTVLDRNVAAFTDPPYILPTAAGVGRWLMVCETHGQAIIAAVGGKTAADDPRLAYRDDAARPVNWCPDCAAGTQPVFTVGKPRTARTAAPHTTPRRTPSGPSRPASLDRLGEAALGLTEIEALATTALAPVPAATPKKAADAANLRRRNALEAIAEIAARARKATGIHLED